MLEKILKEELSRREFLQYAGATLLSLIGLAGFLKTLGNSKPKQIAQDAGYGASVYGGVKKRNF